MLGEIYWESEVLKIGWREGDIQIMGCMNLDKILDWGRTGRGRGVLGGRGGEKYKEKYF